MAKHTQTIRRQQLTNLLSVFDHFVGLALQGPTSESNFGPWDKSIVKYPQIRFLLL